jgi:hypothetical protein
MGMGDNQISRRGRTVTSICSSINSPSIAYPRAIRDEARYRWLVCLDLAHSQVGHTFEYQVRMDRIGRLSRR